jgi:AcrR family transcriptional regulator
MSAQTAVDTRTRIQQVALRLFIENGYEATSLREIAEEIGVTKAALYYHFKSKDEIVTSLIDDNVARLTDLIEWGKTLPRTTEGRTTFVRRYADELYQDRNLDMMRFFERNQTALRENAKSERMRDIMISLLGLLSDRDSPLTTKLRSSLAIFAIHASSFVLRDEKISEEERKDAALEVALDLIKQSSS